MPYIDGDSDYEDEPRQTRITSRFIKPEPQGFKKGIYCMLHKCGIFRQSIVPCGDSHGAQACVDCSYAYIQLINSMQIIHGAHELLQDMGVTPTPNVPKEPSRFEDIL
jgi:hypothetical protein